MSAATLSAAASTVTHAAGTVSTLHNLDSVGTTRAYDYSEATLLRLGRYTARSPMTSESFARLFRETFPALADMDWSNVCLRGGAVVDMLLGTPVHDLDFFFYGLPDEAAVLRRAESIVAFLLKKEREKKRLRDYSSRYTSDPLRVSIKGTRRGPVVTLQSDAITMAGTSRILNGVITNVVPVQLVMCTYRSKESLAAGADMDVTGALFDGERVLMTAEARWSLENMAVRIPDGRFPSQARVKKYFDKGFDIVLPSLDAAKIPKGYLEVGLLEAVLTPHMRFAYSAVDGNKISVNAFLSLDKRASGNTAAAAAAAKASLLSRHYDEAAAMSTAAGMDGKEVLYDNLAKLAAYTRSVQKAAAAKTALAAAAAAAVTMTAAVAVPNFDVFAVADVLQPWPGLTPRQVENSYTGIHNSILEGGKLGVAAYERHVAVQPLRSLLAAVAAAPPPESVAAALAREVGAAVAAQKAASFAALPELAAHFEGRRPPVLVESETFAGTATHVTPAAYYGAYLKV